MRYPFMEQWAMIFTPAILEKIAEKPYDIEHTMSLVSENLEHLVKQSKGLYVFKSRYADYEKYIDSLDNTDKKVSRQMQRKLKTTNNHVKVYIALNDLFNRIKEEDNPALIEYYIVMMVPAVMHFWNLAKNENTGD